MPPGNLKDRGQDNGGYGLELSWSRLDQLVGEANAARLNITDADIMAPFPGERPTINRPWYLEPVNIALFIGLIWFFRKFK